MLGHLIVSPVQKDLCDLLWSLVQMAQISTNTTCEANVHLDLKVAYSIQVKTSKLVSSHAFRPQSSLTAPPCAVSWKQSMSRSQTRTYAAICNDPHARQHQLVCFQQSSHASVPPSSSKRLPDRLQTDIGSRDDPVVCVEPVANLRKGADQSSNFDIIVVQKSGQVSCFSSDLQSCSWSVKLDLNAVIDSSAGFIPRVEIALGFVDYATSHERLLSQRRPDILSQLTSTPAEAKHDLNHNLLLGLMLNSDGGTGESPGATFQLYSVDLRQMRSGLVPKVQKLTSCHIPYSSPISGAVVPSFRFDAKRGTIIEKLPQRVRFHDVFSIRPKILYDLPIQESDLVDCVLIGQSTCVLMTKKKCSLVDLQYGSLQAQKPLHNESYQGNDKKRKRQDSASVNRPFSSLLYFEKSSIVAGMSGSKLMSTRLNMASSNFPSSRVQCSRLADALGRGFQDPGSGTIAPDENSLKLAEIFEYEEAPITGLNEVKPRLKINQTSHELFHALTAKGYLTPKRIQQALINHSNSLHSLPEITPANLIRALADYDKSLVLVAEIIFSSPSPGIELLTHSLRTLLHSFELQTVLLDSGPLLKDVTNFTNGDLDLELQAEEEIATRELQLATELLEGGLEVRTSAIRMCVEKLSTCFTRKDVSRAFNDVLSIHEIILLLDILRHELKDGGWTAHTLDVTLQTGLSESQTGAISAICSVINCAIDALATAILLPGETYQSKDGVDRFITTLRNETSAVLEGVQESSFFDGFLKDFLRYGKVLSDAKVSKFSMKKLKDDNYLEEYLSILAAPAALPIGSRTIEKVSATRIGAGGEIQKRSTRETQYKQREQLGPYSFETIRF